MRDAEHTHTDGRTARLDAREFAALFEQSWRTLWTIGVAVLGRRDEVEDVLQESAMIALSKLEDFDPATCFTAWMGQIVRFTALNSGRRRQRRNAMTSGSNVMLDQAAASHEPTRQRFDGMQQDVEKADQLGLDDRLLDGLMRLSEPQRLCLLLRVVNGCSYREISTTLGMPEGTAMSHVHRGQKAMREMLTGSQDAIGKGEPQ